MLTNSLSEENCEMEQEEKYNRNKGGRPLISDISWSDSVFLLDELTEFHSQST